MLCVKNKLIASCIEWQDDGMCWENIHRQRSSCSSRVSQRHIISVQNQYCFSDANASKSALQKKKGFKFISSEKKRKIQDRILALVQIQPK